LANRLKHIVRYQPIKFCAVDQILLAAVRSVNFSRMKGSFGFDP